MCSPLLKQPLFPPLAGSVWAASGSTLQIINCVFENSRASASGGAVFSLGRVQAVSSVFQFNSAGLSGGAVSAASLSASLSAFQWNSAGASGGGVSATAALDLSLIDLTNNLAGADGGAAFSGGSARLGGVTAALNACGGRGGALFAEGAVTIEAAPASSSSPPRPSSFGGNAAGLSGGAAHCNATASPIRVSGAAFSGNSAAVAAGALFVASNDSAVRSSNFTDNSVDGSFSYAGAASVESALGGASAWSDVRFENNAATHVNRPVRPFEKVTADVFATGKGGALFVVSKFLGASRAFALTLERVDFTGNRATMGSFLAAPGGPGPLRIAASGVTAAQNEAAQSGGALLGQNVSAQFRASSFEGNVAAGDGAALFLIGGLAALEACAFRSNAAARGGAAALWESQTLTADSCMFEGNSAGGAGGASAACSGIAAEALAGLSATYRAFCAAQAAESEAVQSGGGALWLGPFTAATLRSTDLVANSAAGSGFGGAAMVGFGSVFSVSGGSQLANNSAPAGGALGIAGPARVSLVGSRVAGNSAGMGGVVGFALRAELEASVLLRDLEVSGNAADAGTLFANAGSDGPFREPECSGCSVSTLPAANYGDRVATLPRDMRLSVAGASTTVRPGAAFAVGAQVYDGFGSLVRCVCIQCIDAFVAPLAAHILTTPPPLPCTRGRRAQIHENDKAVGSLKCEWQLAPGEGAAPGPCRPGAVVGQDTALYRSGGVQFDTVLVFGPPGARFGLRVSVTGVRVTLAVNATVAQCSTLEAFDEASQMCACVENAFQVPPPKGVAWNTVGGCTCGATAHASADGRSCIPGPAPPASGGALLPRWGIGAVSASVVICFCLTCASMAFVASRFARHKAVESLVIPPSELRVAPAGVHSAGNVPQGQLCEATAADLLCETTVVLFRGTRVACALLRLPTRGTLSDVVSSQSRISGSRGAPSGQDDDEESGYTPSVVESSVVDLSIADDSASNNGDVVGANGAHGANGGGSTGGPAVPKRGSSTGWKQQGVLTSSRQSAPTVLAHPSLSEEGPEALSPQLPRTLSVSAAPGPPVTRPSLTLTATSSGTGAFGGRGFMRRNSDSSRMDSFYEGSVASAKRTIGERLRRISQRVRRSSAGSDAPSAFVDRYSSRGGAPGGSKPALPALSRWRALSRLSFSPPPAHAPPAALPAQPPTRRRHRGPHPRAPRPAQGRPQGPPPAPPPAAPHRRLGLDKSPRPHGRAPPGGGDHLRRRHARRDAVRRAGARRQREPLRPPLLQHRPARHRHRRRGGLEHRLRLPLPPRGARAARRAPHQQDGAPHAEARAQDPPHRPRQGGHVGDVEPLHLARRRRPGPAWLR